MKNANIQFASCFFLMMIVLFLGSDALSQPVCGTTNIALNKPTTSSGPQTPLRESYRAVDGNLNYGYHWDSDPNAVKDANDNVKQWLSVDLGSTFSVCQVRVFCGTYDYAANFNIEMSADGINWTVVSSVTSNTEADRVVNGISGSGRYIRLHLITPQNTSWQTKYSVIEFQVFAAPNKSPATKITKPLNGDQYTAGGNVTLEADASDADGSISKVEFYQGTTKLGESSTSPFKFTWNNVPAGSYSFTTKAYDNFTPVAITTSDAVTITVSNATPSNKAPETSLFGLTNNQAFTTGSNITLTATANDPDGSISKVEFYQGTTKLGEASGTSYTITWNSVPAGNYSLTSKAYDNGSPVLSTISSPINIVVNASGTVSEVDPVFTADQPNLVRVNGTYTNPSWLISLPWSKITSAPSFLTSETDPLAVKLTGAYTNPAWLISLPWSKITSAPSFLTSESDPLAVKIAGSYTNPTWLTSIPVTKVTGLTTSAVMEGSNQYFTTARARAAIVAGNNINYDPLTGVISGTASGTGVENDPIFDLNGVKRNGVYYNPDWLGSIAVSKLDNLPGEEHSLLLRSTTGTITVANFPNQLKYNPESANLIKGYGNTTTGMQNTIFGRENNLSGQLGFAIGNGNEISGYGNMAVGAQNKIFESVNYSTVFGNDNSIYGNFASAYGVGNITRSYSSVYYGRYAEDALSASTSNWVDTDPLFVIGKGTGPSDRSNAVTILKNGSALFSGMARFAGDADFRGSATFVKGAFVAGGFTILSGVLSFPDGTVQTTAATGGGGGGGPETDPLFNSNGVKLNGSYANPQWLTSIPYSKITGAPQSSGWALNGNKDTDVTDFIGTTDNKPLLFKTDGTERLRIDASGRVGIGTGTKIPNDNNFDLFVQLGIRTRKIKVEQSVWADYVFAPEYKLTPLTDLEKYIKKFRHLPEVPSAEEVKANGVDLGDNQVLLLKKLEELTLYVIDLNKKVESLTKENQELKNIMEESKLIKKK